LEDKILLMVPLESQCFSQYIS